MEVILKRTKITTSIINQALRASPDDLRKSEVIGWCLHKEAKLITLYREDTAILTVYRMFDTADIQAPFNGGFVVIVRMSKYTPLNYPFITEQEAKEFLELILKVRETAKTKGQFFK